MVGAERVRAERYQRDKEVAELGALKDRVAAKLHQRQEELIQRAEKESDAELAAIDQEVARSATLPAQRGDETQAEYSSRVAKKQIEEVQASRRATLALMDLQLLQHADHAEAANILEGALATKDASVIARVVTAAERRLQYLAAEASKGATDKGEFATLLRVQQRIRAWREAEAERSPEGKRQRILDRRTLRIAEVRRNVARSVELFGLQDLLAKNARLATIGR